MMLFSLFLLFLFLFLGEMLKSLLGVSIPGSVLGMLMLFLVLLWKRGGPPSWSCTADFMLKNLALLFVPAGVGLVVYGPLLMANAWPLFLVLIGGTSLILAGSAWCMQILLRKGRKDD